MRPGVGYFAADAEAGAELARLRLIEAECDRHSFRYLDAIGVDTGWRCLEVGAGGGSVVRWLSERVGAKGHVVAGRLIRGSSAICVSRTSRCAGATSRAMTSSPPHTTSCTAACFSCTSAIPRKSCGAWQQHCAPAAGWSPKSLTTPSRSRLIPVTLSPKSSTPAIASGSNSPRPPGSPTALRQGPACLHGGSRAHRDGE